MLRTDLTIYERALMRIGSILEWFGADGAAQYWISLTYKHWLERLELE